ENVRKLLKTDVGFEQMFARRVSRLALSRLLFAVDRVAGLALSLTDTAGLLRTIFESRNITRRNGNFDVVVLALADHLAMSDVLLEVLFDPAPHNIAEPAMIFANSHIYFLSFTSPRAKMLAT